jgi:hypothetical protein
MRIILVVVVALAFLVPMWVFIGKRLYDSWADFKKSFDVPSMQDPDPDDWSDEDYTKRSDDP